MIVGRWEDSKRDWGKRDGRQEESMGGSRRRKESEKARQEKWH